MIAEMVVLAALSAPAQVNVQVAVDSRPRERVGLLARLRAAREVRRVLRNMDRGRRTNVRVEAFRVQRAPDIQKIETQQLRQAPVQKPAIRQGSPVQKGGRVEVPHPPVSTKPVSRRLVALGM